MSNQIVNMANQASQAAYEAAKEVVALNNATLESVLKKQFEVASQVVDLGVKQAKLVTDSKDPKLAIKAQVELVEGAADQALSNVREFVNIASQARTAYDKLVDKNVKTVVGKVSA